MVRIIVDATAIKNSRLANVVIGSPVVWVGEWDELYVLFRHDHSIVGLNSRDVQFSLI